ncbi:MAG: DNA recombination protein RmuC, partial [Muribaculaceae bacterium]|nr:DNA recombination protein RmuC [Muribaculaceae bacterium]
ELSLALKGNNKIQGQWGEIVLENVLKSSGLRKNEEYFLQESSSDISPDDAFTRIRPDVIVRYPGSGSVIIDSKTSLNAFIEWVNADEENERHRWGLKHVESIKRHVDELARKAYQRLSKDSGADFVLMFIPNDAAYMAAMQIDGAIWQRAYDKNIIIVSPTLLIGALRIISRQWDYDRQNRNALRIAKTAGSMYDKFVGFVEDMERIENGINSLNRIYSESMKKLRDGSGSLISRAERLKEMGVESKKQLKITGESNNEDDI